MGYFVACMVSRPDRLSRVMTAEQDAVRSLSHPEEEYGWGMGFYQSGEVLHKKRPQPTEGPVDWAQKVQGVRSHCLIGHADRYEQDTIRAENAHPFRMRQWLFAHSGNIERFGAFKERLVEAMPDFIRRNIRGDTASEYLFHAVLSFIHDAGQLDNPDAPEATVVTALRSVVRLVDRLTAEVGAPDGTLNLALTNGRQLYALRRGAPMVVREGSGLPPAEPGLDATADSRDATRYVIVLGGALPRPPTGYQELPDGSMLCIDRDLRVVQHGL